MKLEILDESKTLSVALKTFQPEGKVLLRFEEELKQYFELTHKGVPEANIVIHFINLLKCIFPGHVIETHKSVDFVIRSGGRNSKPAILFETKRSENSNEMIQMSDLNRKAFHELILYYMRERQNENSNIRKLVIHDESNVFLFDSSEFERVFFENEEFYDEYLRWELNQDPWDRKVEAFYRNIAKKFIGKSDASIAATHINLLEYQDLPSNNGDRDKLVHLYKLLSPYNLLKLPVSNDSNVLNKGFYDELLHIIGLEERKSGSKRIIMRLPQDRRNSAALIENAIDQIQYSAEQSNVKYIKKYGTSSEDRVFNIALELCLIWINRILFLKLLEAQLLNYNGGDESFLFLNEGKINDFSELSALFFQVLARESDKRTSYNRNRFSKVPYLNSSLFEKTELEENFGVSELIASKELKIFDKTVLIGSDSKKLTGSMPILRYIFEFLDAFDFGSSVNGHSKQGNKPLINASVLGLIFEKINGYQDGAIYTPGYITMHMSHKVISKTVIEAFQRKYPEWEIENLDDLRNYISKNASTSSVLEFNSIIDNLKICDPAVGSGHFLVSCLNEMIALKSYLGIFANSKGKLITDYIIEVENDELIIMNKTDGKLFNYQTVNSKIPPSIQFMQETMFHEKQKLIENCLFGVDINRNSERICQLRLWIELLKSAYYRNAKVGELETLPSIDINIRSGNSLLSRFALDQSLSSSLKGIGLSIKSYRKLVEEYRHTNSLQRKKEILSEISDIRKYFHKTHLELMDADIKSKEKELEEIKAQLSLSILEDDLKNSQEKKVKKLIEEIKRLNARKIRITKDQVYLQAFEWRYEFPEVLDSKGNFMGFDIVIANPPYMRLQEIEATQREQRDIYEQNFKYTATGLYNLSNIFVELAMNLSKADGNNIFILPHKIFNADYGDTLREYLQNNRAVKQVTHFGANQIFDGVTTYPCIVLFNKQQEDSFRFKHYGLNDDFKSDIQSDSKYSSISYENMESASRYYGKNLWLFFEDNLEYNIFEKCYSTNCCVKDVFESVYAGISTSLDVLYVGRKIDETKEHYKFLVNPDEIDNEYKVETREFLVEKEFFKPMLMGRDIERYGINETNRLVFFPYFSKDGKLVEKENLVKNYPLTNEFVEYYEKTFKQRNKKQKKQPEEYYAYIFTRNLTKFDQKKLIAMTICTNHPNVTIDSNGLYYHSTKIFGLILKKEIKEDYKYFLGIFNSKLFWWFLKKTSDTFRGDGRQISKHYMDPFPLPMNPNPKNVENIVNSVEKLLKMGADDSNQVERKTLENEIDSEVYALYGLDEIERQRIDLMW